MAVYPPIPVSRDSSKVPQNAGFRIRVIDSNVAVDDVVVGQSFAMGIVHTFITTAEKDQLLALWEANKGTEITLVWPEDWQQKDADLAGDIQSSGANTVELESGASAVDDTYNGWWVQVDCSQYREVVDYDGASRIATVSPSFSPVPSSTYALHENLVPLSFYMTGRPVESNTDGGWWEVSVQGVASE